MDRRTFGKLLTAGLIATDLLPDIFQGSDLAGAQGFPGHWKARWIWTTGETHRSFHYFLMARRDFDLGSTPRSAKLDITAFDRYVLYVNGEYVGRGPARSDARWKSYDRP